MFKTFILFNPDDWSAFIQGVLKYVTLLKAVKLDQNVVKCRQPNISISSHSRYVPLDRWILTTNNDRKLY